MKTDRSCSTFVLSSLLCVSLAACGGSDDGGTAGADASTSGDGSGSAVAAAAGSPDAGAADSARVWIDIMAASAVPAAADGGEGTTVEVRR
jgi:hypothetical protein